MATLLRSLLQRGISRLPSLIKNTCSDFQQMRSISSSSSSSSSSSGSTQQHGIPQFIALYDGKCPLCVFEVDWLKGRSERINAPISYVDITQPSKVRGTTLEPLIARHFNLFSRDDFEVLMSRLHGIKVQKDEASGTIETKIETGLEVVTAMYEHAGLHWIAKPFIWSWSRPIAQRLYILFAKNRLWLTGRQMEIPLECDANSCRHIKSK